MNTTLGSQLGLPVTLFFGALLIRGLFAFLETTLTALRLFKLKEIARTHQQYAALLDALEKQSQRVLVTTLITSSFAEVSAASLGTFIIERLFKYFNFSTSVGFSLGIALTSLTIILFGEIIPKGLAKSYGERTFASLLWLMNVVYRLLYPLVSLLMYFSDNIVSRLGGTPLHEDTNLTSEREIRFLINYVREKGQLDTEKAEMIQNVFELDRTTVREIMRPATDIISLSMETSLNQTLPLFSEYQFTRLPVYKDTPDNIIGVVHQKDIFILLSRGENKSLESLVRPIMFIPESVKTSQLLREFRQQHMHIAMVLNEHGILTGLVTLEDVLEEIVGDIIDEHEPISEKIIPLQQGGWMVDASIPLEDLSDFLDTRFETEGAITLGGFLTEQLQHLPQKGERLPYADFYFQIQKASNRRVRQVLIFKKSMSPESSSLIELD